LVLCDRPQVPRAVGLRLPDRDKLKDNSHAEELHAVIVLSMFTLWRTRSDARHGASTWAHDLEAASLSPFAVEKMYTFQSWYDGSEGVGAEGSMAEAADN